MLQVIPASISFSKSLRLSIFLFSFGLSALAQEWNVSRIPDSLKANAHTVIRLYDLRYEAISESKQVLQVHKVITVLDRKGENYANLEIQYDPLIDVGPIHITLFDQNGFLIRKVKPSEIKDESSAQGGALFTDDRKKSFHSYQPLFPYTIEYQYEIVYRSLFYSPTWLPVDALQTSLQASSFELSFPESLGLRMREQKLDAPANASKNGDKLVYTWKLHSVSAIQEEPYSPGALELLPMVRIAPSAFSYNKYKGSMSSWQEIGSWQMKLIEGRQLLPPATRDIIRNLADSFSSPREKVRRLYKYMQSRTRYVSIQVGIGGWQPFPAEMVDKTGYGDCKALSNFMISILEEAGIPAFYTLIYAGEDAPPMEIGFPSRRFNHVIVCVPQENDTIWLECTSQIMPFGFLGSFTDDRYALAIGRTGTSLLRTPSYSKEENALSVKADIMIDRDGNGKAEVLYTFSGLQAEDLFQLEALGPEEQRKAIYSSLDLPAYEIKSHSLSILSDSIPSASLEMQLNLNRYSSTSGMRIFVPLNKINAYSGIPRRLKNRKTEVEIRRSSMGRESIRYQLPAGTEVEYLPAPHSIRSPFGWYTSSVEVRDGALYYTREFVLLKTRLAPDAYNDLVNFLKDVASADNEQAVLLRTY